MQRTIEIDSTLMSMDHGKDDLATIAWHLDVAEALVAILPGTTYEGEHNYPTLKTTAHPATVRAAIKRVAMIGKTGPYAHMEQ